ncbi:type II toxin-antitoxin system Phd/YefM family antitoxin [Candidatus Gottesmanbacteria bacterium]|nr:type II toxin-antitoxin system Phd/YefM family antitoxin [Candidatus Gottesmanbacteria bacterium]MBI5452761.1 type II toxin-antitoxin system Phd/YefM family antitoxin [Candidatus Gottesmanbacteria bacterium]
MKTVSVYELRDNLAYFLNLVEKNQSPIIVEKYKKPTAIISPYIKGKIRDPLSFQGFLGKGVSGVEFVNRIRRSKSEREYVKKLLRKRM